jgi:CheY-like chemotaxis protein
MPTMDGYEATRRIRALEEGSDERTLIVALSASAFEHERSAVVEAGCDDFVAKPFRGSTIFETLSRHLEARFLRGEPARAKAEAAEPVSTVGVAPEVLSALREALTLGDLQAASGLADQIRDRHETLARALQAMIRNYQIDEAMQLLEG